MIMCTGKLCFFFFIIYVIMMDGDNLLMTHSMTYREWGWKIFEAFEEHTKLPNGGYAALRDVTVIPPPQDDRMDTFFLVSTLNRKMNAINCAYYIGFCRPRL